MSESYSRAEPQPVFGLEVAARATFISRTYSHLLAAITLFTFIEVMLFRLGWAERIYEFVAGTSWLVFMGGFMVLGWIFSRVARMSTSLPAQYAGLIAYVAAEAKAGRNAESGLVPRCSASIDTHPT